jgi:hypothetical protein
LRFTSLTGRSHSRRFGYAAPAQAAKAVPALTKTTAVAVYFGGLVHIDLRAIVNDVHPGSVNIVTIIKAHPENFFVIIILVFAGKIFEVNTEALKIINRHPALINVIYIQQFNAVADQDVLHFFNGFHIPPDVPLFGIGRIGSGWFSSAAGTAPVVKSGAANIIAVFPVAAAGTQLPAAFEAGFGIFGMRFVGHFQVSAKIETFIID